MSGDNDKGPHRTRRSARLIAVRYPEIYYLKDSSHNLAKFRIFHCGAETIFNNAAAAYYVRYGRQQLRTTAFLIRLTTLVVQVFYHVVYVHRTYSMAWPSRY